MLRNTPSDLSHIKCDVNQEQPDIITGGSWEFCVQSISFNIESVAQTNHLAVRLSYCRGSSKSPLLVAFSPTPVNTTVHFPPIWCNGNYITSVCSAELVDLATEQVIAPRGPVYILVAGRKW